MTAFGLVVTFAVVWGIGSVTLCGALVLAKRADRAIQDHDVGLMRSVTGTPCGNQSGRKR